MWYVQDDLSSLLLNDPFAPRLYKIAPDYRRGQHIQYLTMCFKRHLSAVFPKYCFPALSSFFPQTSNTTADGKEMMIGLITLVRITYRSQNSIWIVGEEICSQADNHWVSGDEKRRSLHKIRTMFSGLTNNVLLI